MIKLEVINAYNMDRIGIYLFHKNQLSCGSDISNSIYFEDPVIGSKHITLLVTDEKLYLIPNSESYSIHVNNKITSAKKLLKINDIIKFGSIELKILNFGFDVFMNRRDFLNQKVQDIPEKQPELLEILQELSNEK